MAIDPISARALASAIPGIQKTGASSAAADGAAQSAATSFTDSLTHLIDSVNLAQVLGRQPSQSR